jgi:esterase/lipase
VRTNKEHHDSLISDFKQLDRQYNLQLDQYRQDAEKKIKELDDAYINSLEQLTKEVS